MMSEMRLAEEDRMEEEIELEDMEGPEEEVSATFSIGIFHAIFLWSNLLLPNKPIWDPN
jgi:hypothetical protein